MQCLRGFPVSEVKLLSSKRRANCSCVAKNRRNQAKKVWILAAKPVSSLVNTCLFFLCGGICFISVSRKLTYGKAVFDEKHLPRDNNLGWQCTFKNPICVREPEHNGFVGIHSLLRENYSPVVLNNSLHTSTRYLNWTRFNLAPRGSISELWVRLSCYNYSINPSNVLKLK